MSHHIQREQKRRKRPGLQHERGQLMQALGNMQQVTRREEDGYSFQASKPALCITKITSDISSESSAPPQKSYCSLIVLFGMYSVFQKLGACSLPAWLWNVGQQFERARWWATLFYPNPPPQQEKGIKQHYFSPWMFTEIILSHTIIQDCFAQYKVTWKGPVVLWKPLGSNTLGRGHGWSWWAQSSRKV